MDSSVDRLALGFNPVGDATPISTFTLIMFQSYLPEDLWDPNRQREVEEWLLANIQEPLLRKEILIDWCAYFNIPFTREKSIAIKSGEYP